MRFRTTFLALLVCACLDKDAPQPMQKASLNFPPPPTAPAAPPQNKSPLTLAEYPTTDGAIAVSNLEAQIAGLEKARAKGEQGVVLVGAYLMRAQYLGKLADYDRAEALAVQLVKDAPKDPNMLLVRAAVRGALHQYKDALVDLDAAGKKIKDGRVELARAVILQATGRYDEALALRQANTKLRETLQNLAAEANVRADRGEIAEAERLYTAAQYKTRDVSPFPFAFLHLQQGLMWQREGRFARARELFEAAHQRIPAYAPATSHLAATLAQLGEKQKAVELLLPLVEKSDDPEYAAQLGTIGGDQTMLARAKKGYEELVAKHPDAFADHAARFYLGAGADPKKALALAQRNFKLRPTPEAHQLVIEAALAATDNKAACATADAAMKLPHKITGLAAAAAKAYSACGKPEQSAAARKVADEATAAAAAALTSRASSAPENAAAGP